MSESPTPNSLTPVEGKQAMWVLAEWLLLETVPDLQRRLSSDDRYETIGIAYLLRRLQQDQNPLVHLARARLSLPAPRFRYTPYTVRPSGEDRWKLLLASSDETFALPTVEGGLEELLAAPVGQFRDEPVTVKDLVRYIANVHGAVHIGEPTTGFEAEIQRLLATYDGAYYYWTMPLRAIAKVVLDGIAPVVSALREVNEWLPVVTPDVVDRVELELPVTRTDDEDLPTVGPSA